MLRYHLALVVVASFVLLPNLVFAKKPATVAEAAELLDLATLPLPAGAERSGYRREAELSYRVKQPAKKAFAFVHEQLLKRRWKQLSDVQNHGDFISADYQRDGFTVHLSVFPGQAGEVAVMLSHKGNVSLEELPVPDNAEKMYAFPAVVMYKSPDDVEKTAAACRAKMVAAGWSPYGGAGSVDYYRQNAVQVDVNVISAPAQGGATVISVSSKLLSLELPAPAFTDNFRYSDGTTAIDFDTDKSPQEVADFYREQLAPEGWKATTTQPVKIKWKEHTIFRNQAQAMITIATHDFEDRTRVHLDHQNAAEVAEEQLRSDIAFGEKAKYRDVEWLPVSLTIPQKFVAAPLEDWALKFETNQNDSFPIAEQLVEQLQAAGWSLEGEKPTDQPVIREYRLHQKERTIKVLALQHDKLPSWVAAVGIGGVKFVAGE